MSIDLTSLGLSADTLGNLSTFKPSASSGRLLLYDGDGACYTHTAGVKRIETAYNRFQTDILTMMYLTKCEHAIVHLTPSGCFKNGRHLLLGVKRYQENRDGVKKPDLLNVLRNTVHQRFADHPDFTIVPNYEIEADDGLMIDAHRYPEAIMLSADKDLLINPFMHYDPETGKFIKLNNGDRFGWIARKDWFTPNGKKMSKCVGKGTKFFLAQCLMGDSADNVQGVLKLKGKACGFAGTLAYLDPITCEHEAVNAVIDAYRVIDQNIAPEAEAMWLLRDRDDSAYKFFTESELTTENKHFLSDCYFNRKWKLTTEEYEDELHNA